MENERLLEDRVHGDSMFPLKIYMVDYLDGEVIINLHWHQETEFLFLKEGTALFQIGTTVKKVQAGEVVFIPSGQLHAAYPYKQSSFQLYAIVFDLALLNSATYDTIQSTYLDLLLNLDKARPFFIPKEDWGKSIINSLTSIIKGYEDHYYGFELTIKAHLYLITCGLIQNNALHLEIESTQIADLAKINRLKLVLKYIDDHFQERLSVEQLASLIQMSEGHFSRFFKSLVRMTPVEYINSVRINKAAKLIRETDRKIIDISMEVGFDTPSYFIKMFKRQKKYTPSKFRKGGEIEGRLF